MKTIGIVNFHRAHNYGAVYVAYAMVKVMEFFGLNAKIIDYQHPESKLSYDFVPWNPHKSAGQNIHNIISQGILGRYKRRRKAFYRFVDKNIPLTRKYRSRFDIKEHFDYLVCGSDQIWSPKISDSRDDIFFLDFGGKDSIRFSYAASSGGYEIQAVEEGRTGFLLSSLKRIGVREDFMKDYIDKTFRLESTVNPDPTLLLPQDEWVKLEEYVRNLPGKYLLVYSLRREQDVLAFSAELGNKLGLPVVHINNYSNVRKNIMKGADISLFDISPGQFLWLFHHSSFVVSNSFHGNAFSVIYRKDFVCPVFDSKDTRIETLHERIGLGRTRLLSSAARFDSSLRHIDYTLLQDKIEQFRREGFEFIKECLSIV